MLFASLGLGLAFCHNIFKLILAISVRCPLFSSYYCRSKVKRQKTRPDPIYILIIVDLSLTGDVSSIYYYLLLSTEQVRRWKLNKNEPNSRNPKNQFPMFKDGANHILHCKSGLKVEDLDVLPHLLNIDDAIPS